MKPAPRSPHKSKEELMDAFEPENRRVSCKRQSAGSVNQCVSPLINPGHPASVAYRITMSPHEWTWTQKEVEAMARHIVKQDSQNRWLYQK